MASRKTLATVFLLISFSLFGIAQSKTPPPDLSTLPRIIKYSGALKTSDGQPRSGTVGVIFAIYDREAGLSPIWLESQSVTADDTGHYSVLLGSTNPAGLPASIFSSGEARWIGVQSDGQAEQPRTLLVSVPYALKAGDADTLGGKPLSAFLLADTSTASRAQREKTAAISNGATSGVVNFVAKFDSTASIVNSSIFDTGVAVGIGTTSPAATLDVSGLIRTLNGIKFGDGTIQSTAVPSNCAATQIVKWTGSAWSCAAESGTITGITTTAGLTGGGTSGNLILQLDPTIVRADVSNNFTARQSVIGSTASVLLSATQSNSVVLAGQPTFLQAQTSIPAGVAGYSTSLTGTAAGVAGFSSSISAPAVLGWNGSTTGVNDSATGVLGVTDNPIGRAVEGEANSLSGNTVGVRGKSVSTSGTGIAGNATAGSGFTVGVFGGVNSPDGIGVTGNASSGSGFTVGVEGNVNSPLGTAGLFTAPSSVGAYFLRGNAGGTDRFKVDGTGTVFAAAYKDLNGNPISGGGSGTVTSVIAGSGLSGGVITTSGTLSVDSTVARVNANNNFSAPQTFLSSVGVVDISAANGLFLATLPPSSPSPVGTNRVLVEAGAGLDGMSVVAQDANGVIDFLTGGDTAATNTRMHIDAAGKVGIGTQTPTQALDVVGTVNATFFVGNGSGITGITATTLGGVAAGSYARIDQPQTFATTQTFNAGDGGQIISGKDNGTEIFTVNGANTNFTVSASQAKPGPATLDINAPTTDYPAAIRGEATNTVGIVGGVQGISASVDGGAGVAGISTTLTGTGVGVFGGAKSDGTAYGVSGHTFSLTGAGAGVVGQSDSSVGVGVQGYAQAVSGPNYGVQGTSESTNGVGVLGLANSASGFNVGILGITNSATGTAGFFKNAADGQILSGRNSSGQIFSVSGTGAVTATSFTGSGAGLTGVTAATATNATQLGGVAAANFPTLTAATDQSFTSSLTLPELNLPATTSSTLGVINLGGSSFIHKVGTQNTFVGESAGNFALTGISNSGIGYFALNSLTTGNSNTAVGRNALKATTSGGSNVAIGLSALANNTTGTQNVALGTALTSNTIGGNNVAIGSSALGSNISGNSNIALGQSALSVNTTGFQNQAVGVQALQSNSTGNNNAAFGTLSLLAATASFNSSFGSSALRSTTTGSLNAALGYQAGYTLTPANANTTGANNTFVGANSGPGTPTQLNNATAIGSGALVSQSNSIVLGDGTVNVGIGTQTPAQALDVVGTVRATSYIGDGSALSNITASNAASLGGIDAANYAQNGVSNTFTANQSVNANTVSGTASLSVAQAGAGAGLNISAPGLGTFPNDAVIVATATDASGASAPNVPRAILAIVSSSGGRGVQGNSQATTGNGVGVIGFSSGSSGSGVYGQENSATGPTNGVAGVSLSTNGAGVYGEADATSGNTAGVRGIALSPSGKGTEGDAFPTTANAVTSAGTGVLGTFGFNSDFSTNPNATGGYGVRGQTAGSGGFSTGVRGDALSNTGNVIGVEGFTLSNSGVGVKGEADASSGVTVGVLGIVTSPSGIAGYFENDGGGKILSGNNNGTEVFSVSGAGVVTATSFSGSGASLTGVTAATATNATQLGGVAAANYPTLNAASNQTFTSSLTMPLMALPTTTSSTSGVITSNGNRFLHSFGTNNLFLGVNAGNFSTTGTGGNTGLGVLALSSVTTGFSNTATGSNALKLNLIGNHNTAIGASALQNATGNGNTATGSAALLLNTAGIENTATGLGSLLSNTSGNYNIAIGSDALSGNTTGANNTALGKSAGTTTAFANENTTGSNNTFIGYNSGPGTPTQLTNATAIGANALVSQSNSIVLGDGTVKVGIGTSTPTQALDVVGNINASGTISGDGSGLTNVNPTLLGGVAAISYARLDVPTDESFAGTLTTPQLNLPSTASAAVGVLTIGGNRFAHSFGVQNTFLGSGTGNFAMTGGSNTGLGFQALLNNTTGTANTATGSQALQLNTTGSSNTANGTFTLFFNTSGGGNTASGYSALFSNNIGIRNTADGAFALTTNTSGNLNVATGFRALEQNAFGSSNSASGYYALQQNTSGDANTALGFQAGYTATPANANTTGSNNTFLGYNSGPGTPTQLTNATAIGSGALVSQSNSMVLGNGSVKVGIGTETPTQTLDVIGTVKATSFSGSGALLTGIPNSATSGTSFDTANSLVARNATGGFTAGTLTLDDVNITSLAGSSITGSLAGDILTLNQAGAGRALVATSQGGNAISTSSVSGNALSASSTNGQSVFASSDGAVGLFSQTTATTAASVAIRGTSFSTTGNSVGMQGIASASTAGVGVAGTGQAGGAQGVATSSTGFGVKGFSSSATGATVGVLGLVSSPSGIAGTFNNTGGGQILSGQNNSVEKFSVSGTGNGTFSGSVTATNFIGQLGGVASSNYARLDTGNSFASTQTFLPASSSTGVAITQTGTGTGLDVETGSSTLPALFAHSSATSGFPTGVWGQSDAPSGIGVRGTGTAATGGGIGVYGESSALSGVGVWGQPTHPTGNTVGVYGINPSSGGTGIWGRVTDTTGGSTVGVEGDVFSANGIAGKFVSNNSSGKIISGRDSISEVFAVNGTGNISAYNGNPTAGNGVASVHGSFSSAVGALTPVNTTTLFTPSGATGGGLYRATCYMVNTASATGPNGIATIHWTDDSGTAQSGICSTFVTTTLGDYVTGSVMVQSAGAITFSVTANAATYKIYISLEKLI
ncbi:MAG: hypothetical protein JWO20_2339 [Candidatus Angelobacter sp.]|nr:hypothetical protein [Candidatus Angelobacter sp.]